MYSRMAKDLRRGRPLVVTVHVALCDNTWQGIVPVPAFLGNGDRPRTNLYWGAMHGLFGELRRSRRWRLVARRRGVSPDIFEVAVFSRRFAPGRFWRRHGVRRPFKVYVVGYAWRGRRIGRAVSAFVRDVYNDRSAILQLKAGNRIAGRGGSHVVGFIGHNHLMDVSVRRYPFSGVRRSQRLAKGVFVLACRSHRYFARRMLNSNTANLAMTRTLMAPEAYTVRYLLNALASGADSRGLLQACVAAYARYQRINRRRARTVFRVGR